MYTLPMSRSFRTLALSVTMLWALVPQIACFMPDQMTETEQQCCKEMASDCGGASMSHACCQTVVRPNAGTLAKAGGISPDFTFADRTLDMAALVPLPRSGNFAFTTNHAPPHDSETSPVILRI